MHKIKQPRSQRLNLIQQKMAGNQCLIHSNDQENPWVIYVNEQLKEISDTPTAENEKNRWQRRSIYKLPDSIKNVKKKAYTPEVVSLGPYHYEDENLKPMEEHKDRALLHFLKRSRKPFQSYYRSLAEVVQDLKQVYDPLDPHLQKDSDAFLRIMIRDGVFMLEILRSSNEGLEDYAPNDPVFSDHGRLHVMPLIRRDMLMLENQIPTMVLHKLLAVEKGLTQEDEDFTNELVFRFFFPDTRNIAPSKCLHALDMYRKILLGTTMEAATDTPYGTLRSRDDVIPCALELAEAGIIIKRSKSRSLRDITFHRGILTLPTIVVDDITEPLFLNLVAFERYHVGAGTEVSGFVFFMGNIIDNNKDISLLSSKKIIQNCVGSDKTAAKLFNSLSKDVVLDPECGLGMVCSDINEYCKKRFPRYRANLIQTYFRSPWALLSVLAAVVLFALTIVQTVYAILASFKP